MRRKPALLVQFVLLAIGTLHVAASLGASPQTRDNPGRLPDQIQTVRDFAELRARTPSEQQRAVAFNVPLGPKIPELGRGEVPHSSLHPGPTVSGALEPGVARPSITEEERLGPILCASDGVVIGRADSRRTLLTMGESYLFTDYDVTVDRWLTAPLSEARIIVSHQGGEVSVAGDVRRVGSLSFPVLHLKQAYILILQAIRRAPGFTFASDPVPIDASVLATIDTSQPPNQTDRSYLATVRRAIAACPHR